MLYDIIGDIHGHADKLETLLKRLGYGAKNGKYSCDNRTAVFVGDFIDRGTQNQKVIEIVRGMIENGSAHAVMGNHEYNAVCYHTPTSDGGFLRPHTESKNRQHENFLKEFPLGGSDTKEVVEWFKTLPLYLDFDHFRVIHACWDEQAIDQVQSYLNNDNSLKLDMYPKSATKNSDLFDLVERLLKGVEIKLPEPYSFKDKDGKERHHIRVKWWGDADASYRDLAFGYGDEQETFPTSTVSEEADIPFYGQGSRPVFFGHYWMKGTPKVQKDNVCCVDYSAGIGGDLVCYSLDQTNEAGKLLNKNFTTI